MTVSILFLVAGLLFLLTAVLWFITGDLIKGLLFLALAVSNGVLGWHYRAKATGALPEREHLPKVLGIQMHWHLAVSVVALAFAVGLLVAVIVGDFT